MLYPDGSFTMGLGLSSDPSVPPSRTGLVANVSNLFGTTAGVASIENAFQYKPIDENTVLFMGDPLFTFTDCRTIRSIQMSVYRRIGHSPWSSCRSVANPQGTLCWTELGEEFVYAQPLLGEGPR